MTDMVIETSTQVIKGPDGTKFAFEVRLHNRADDPSAGLETDFYTNNEQAVPEGDHFELELLKGPKGILTTSHVHRHQNPETKKWFVCYTAPLPTREEAEEFFRVWCIGTVYTFIYGEDFASILGEAVAGSEDNEPFFNLMHHKHQIEVCH